MELVDSHRASALALAPNVVVVRRRRDGRVVQINMLSFGDDHNARPGRGNPQAMIHDHETETNPPRVWELKRA
jgi:hypothetical protein